MLESVGLGWIKGRPLAPLAPLDPLAPLHPRDPLTLDPLAPLHPLDRMTHLPQQMGQGGQVPAGPEKLRKSMLAL